MVLFDDFERTAGLSELRRLSLFEGYNQAPGAGAAAFREMCNDWFSRLPSSGKLDLKRRFTSGDDDQFKSAWFELMLHELLLRLGFAADVHPAVSHTSKRPDFLASGEDGRFYLEAVAISATADDRRVTAAEDTVFGWIDELDTPEFSLIPHVTGELTGQPSKARFVSPIQKLMDSHSRSEVEQQLEQGQRGPTTEIRDGDWSLEVELRPNPTGLATAGTFLIQPLVTADLQESDDLLAGKIRGKASEKRSSGLDAPFVVAAIVSTLNFVPEMDAFRILHSLWTDQGGKPQYRNCHAVWLFPLPWATAVPLSFYQPWLILNPRVETHLPAELLQVPHARQPSDWVGGVDITQLLSA